MTITYVRLALAILLAPILLQGVFAATASVDIAPWYPKGNNYVFVCNNDISATKYNWYFGDGQKIIGGTNKDVYHTYSEGTYTVRCEAINGNTMVSGERTVTVGQGSSACFSKVADIPASCTGGSITQDSVSGTCRSITCSSGSSSLNVLACDKPDSGSKQYFEMYKTGQTGSTVEKVCLGSTCITNYQYSGYAKSSNYPVCTQPPACTPSNEVCDQKDNDCDGLADEGNVCQTSASMDVAIAPWYPKENNYVFNCNADGYTPDSYTIDFGDGQKIVNTQSKSFYHTYTSNGQYTVSCTGKDATQSKTGNIQVSVNTKTETQPRVTLNVAQGFPTDQNYVFQCNAAGITPTSYTWNFGDGTTHSGKVFDVFHQYNSAGNKTVSCTASDGTKSAVGTTMVNVVSPDFSDTYTALMDVKDMGENNFEFTCNTVGFNGDKYAWFARGLEGQDTELDGVQTNSPTITYHFTETGNYEISCTAYELNGEEHAGYYSEGAGYHNTSAWCNAMPAGQCFEEGVKATFAVG
jgi:PKD repeat protein